MHYNDLGSEGYKSLRHHDRSFDVQYRLVSFGCRIGGPDQGDGEGWDGFGQLQGVRQNWGGEETHGDILNWGMWPIDTTKAGSQPGGNSRTIPGWAQAWAAITVPAQGATDSGSGSGAPIGVQPVYDRSWKADPRFVVKTVPSPPGAMDIPLGTPGIVVTGTNEYSQEDLFLPFLPNTLIAPHHDGKASMGTLVYDLKSTNEVDNLRKAHLQTLARVWEIGDPASPNPILQALCGPIGEHALAIQMGATRGGVNSRAAFADFGVDFGPFPKQLIGLGSWQCGGPLHPGSKNDKHGFGKNEDDDHITSLHIPTKALFFRNVAEDAPLAFGATWEEPKSAGEMWETFLRYDPNALHEHVTGMKQGLWRWETRVPVYYPDHKRGDKPPSDEPGRKGPADEPGGKQPDEEAGRKPASDDPSHKIVNGDDGKLILADKSTSEKGVNDESGNNKLFNSDDGKLILTDKALDEKGANDDTGVHKIVNNDDGKLILTDKALDEKGASDEQGKGAGDDKGINDDKGIDVGKSPLDDSYLKPPIIDQSAPSDNQQTFNPGTESRFAQKSLPTLRTLNEIGAPGLTFFPQGRGLRWTDYRNSTNWSSDDAAFVDGKVPAVVRLEAIGSETTDGEFNFFEVPGNGRYGQSAAGGLWVMPPNVNSTDIWDGNVPASFPSTGFNLYQSKIGFGTPTAGGLVANGVLIRLSGSTLIGDVTDSSGNVSSSTTLFPVSTSGPYSYNGGQTNSEEFGSGASVSGTGACAFGKSAAANTNSVAVGFNSFASATKAVAVGEAATASGNGSVAIGGGVTASGGQSIAIGDPTTCGGLEAIAMGYLATVTGAAYAVALGSRSGAGTRSVAVGHLASAAEGVGLQQNVAIGDTASAPANDGVSIGYLTIGAAYAICVGSTSSCDTSGVALGYGAGSYGGAGHGPSVAIGRGSFVDSANAVAFGSDSYPLTTYYLGKGYGTLANDPTGGVATTTAVTLKNTDGIGTNIAGSHFYVEPSLATGNAASGEFVVKVGQAGASGTTIQTSTERFRVNAAGVTITGTTQHTDKITKYNNVTTAGYGVAPVYASGWVTGQTAANTSVATYTPSADGTFEASAFVNVTAVATANFSVQVTYTDETNTAQTANLLITQNDASTHTAITNSTGTGPYYCPVIQFRAKASTAITVKTSGTFTSVTYDMSASIKQIA